MKYLAVVLAIFLCTSAAHADICTQKTNLAPSPSAQLRSMSNGWLQWLNRSYTFSCSGTATHLKCTHNTEAYDFYYYCDNTYCYTDAYDVNGWRNEAITNPGDTWNWKWDGWKNGYLQITCLVGWPNTCTQNTYGTCD